MSKVNDKNQKKGHAEQRPVFDTIRKPVAPPGRVLGDAKPEERAHPAERKVKHKHPPATEDE